MRLAGDVLGSANSVRLTQNRRFLLVTNAGSNDVSVFRVEGRADADRLRGDRHVLEQRRDEPNNVVVLNAAGQGTRATG